MKNWIKDKIDSLIYGVKIETANDGKPVEQLVIRHKDFYFYIDIDVESGEPTGDFGWNDNTPITHTPIRDFYRTVKDTK